MKTAREVKKRWLSPTPKFWKSVQRIGIFVGGLGLVVAAPPVGLAVLGILSQLTVENSTNLENQ